MDFKNRIVFFSKAIITYLFLVALLVGLNFIYHISKILASDLVVAIGGLILLGIYLFISSINIVFLIRKKTSRDYKLILLINMVFSLMSGIAIRLPSLLFANNLGADISIVYLKTEVTSTCFFHLDAFNFIVKLQHSNLNEPVFGFQINLIMWGISAFLLFCYKARALQNPNNLS